MESKTMFDAKKLIDQMLGAGGSANLQGTLGSVLGQLGQVAGQAQDKAGAAMNEASKMSPSEMAGKAKGYVSNNAGALATGALAGTLMTVLLGTKGGRSLGGSALKIGGLAAIGGLAYKAWQDYQAGRPPLGLGGGTTTAAGGDPEPTLLPAPAHTGFGTDAVAMLALEAMISAAKADGHVDDRERARIMGEFGQVGTDPEAQRFLEAELLKPVDIDALAAKAATPELASQVYAASLLAIDPDTDVERAYLAALAQRLNLDQALRSHIENAVNSAKVA
jgi:uncharacterized membrane protein YebE (DUF533 family)